MAQVSSTPTLNKNRMLNQLCDCYDVRKNRYRPEAFEPKDII